MRTIKCYNFLKIEKENEKEEKVESIRHFCSIEVFKVLWRNNGYIYETILLFLRNSISFNQSSFWVINFQNQSDFLSFITPLAYSLVSYDTAGETIHIFRVIIQFHLTNAFIPVPIFRSRFNVYYSSIQSQRIFEETKIFRNFFSLFFLKFEGPFLDDVSYCTNILIFNKFTSSAISKRDL